MHHKKVILFLILAGAFALTHYFAMAASLYWYFWWFDILMHFWGGLLLGLGVHAVTSFSFVSLKPSLTLVLVTILIATSAWEIFEWAYRLYNPISYLADTAQDVLLGFGGGLLAHFTLQTYTMK